MVEILISLVPLLPLLGFLVIGLSGKRLSHGVASTIACGVVLISFVISIGLFAQLLSVPEDQRSFQVMLTPWITAGNFSVNISFLVDPLSSVMLLIITGVGFLIHVYSVGYMHGVILSRQKTNNPKAKSAKPIRHWRSFKSCTRLNSSPVIIPLTNADLSGKHRLNPLSTNYTNGL